MFIFPCNKRRVLGLRG